MQAIVFLGTQKSGSSREALRAAQRMGYYTILFTDRQNHLTQRSEFLDVNQMQSCDLKNLQEIRMNLIKLQMQSVDIAAIVSFVDAHCHTACMMAEEMGLNNFSCHAIKNMKNKIISREIISQTEYSPWFLALSAQTALNDIEPAIRLFGYPFIIKSPNSTGSADVFKINNREELNYYLYLLKRKHPSESILVEEMLDGPQFLVEVLVYEKKVMIAAIIEQEVTFFQRFIITGYNLILDLNEDFKDLPEAVTAIVHAHGMEYGACHLEMRLVEGQWKLIEINPRISGGAMNKLIKLGFGIDLVAETLKISLGSEPDLMSQHKQHIFVQYRIVAQSGILEKVTGMNRAAKSEGVLEVYVRPRRGAYLQPPLSMGNRYAYVIAAGDSEEEATTNAKAAAAKIKFWLRNTDDNKTDNIKPITAAQIPNPHSSMRLNRDF